MKTEQLEIFDHMPVYVWAKDEKGRILWTNKALKALFSDEMVGKTDYDFLEKSSADSVVAVDKRVLETNAPAFVHERVKMQGKEPKVYSVCKFPAEFEGKRCTFGIGFAID